MPYIPIDYVKNIGEMLEREITDKDFVIIKLLTLCRVKINGQSAWETDVKICPARIIIDENNIVKWHIYDIMDDTLLIEASPDERFFGSATNVFDDNDGSGLPDYIHIIVKCGLIDTKHIFTELHNTTKAIYQNNAEHTLITDSNITDTYIITHELNKYGIQVNFNKKE